MLLVMPNKLFRRPGVLPQSLSQGYATLRSRVVPFSRLYPQSRHSVDGLGYRAGKSDTPVTKCVDPYVEGVALRKHAAKLRLYLAIFFP